MRTRAVIHLDNFAENIGEVARRIGKKVKICIPVKANGYGHGAVEIAGAGLEAGAFCLGVATAAEGTELRKNGIKSPVLLFSQPMPDEISEIISAGLTPFVSDAEFASELNKQAAAEKCKVPVHIKIDTGMGRLGCPAEDALSLARHIGNCERLALEGTATHYAVSDSTESGDISFTKKQTAVFNEITNSMKAAGIDPGIIHAANSGAVILHPDSFFDMVRPGILLYGYKTANENDIENFPFEPVNAKPVMELRAAVAMIKKIKKGETVSYGRTWTAPEDTVIAVISAGYADGFPRNASGKWQVEINGQTYPLAGRICMDQCMADLGQETKVKRWDEAVIFGAAGKDAGHLAKLTGTIPYEITCNINKRVPREYKLKI